MTCNEIQASARTCGRSAAVRIIKNVGSSQVKSVYFNHPSQGNSANCYLILGLRDKAAPSTSQQINKFPPKRVKNLATPSSVFIFIFSSSTGELWSQPIRGNVRRIGRMLPYGGRGGGGWLGRGGGGGWVGGGGGGSQRHKRKIQTS